MTNLGGRTSAVFAWPLCAVFIAAAGVGVVLDLLSTNRQPDDIGPVLAVLLPLGSLAYPITGAIIVSRRDRNLIGWLFLGTGFVFGFAWLAESYARFQPGPLPGREYAAWYGAIVGQSPALFTLFTFFLLLFPDGHLPSRRWRHLARVSAAATGLLVAFLALKPGILAETHPPTPNPLAVGSVEPLWRIVELPVFFAVMLCVPAAAVAFVLRFRRSRGVERQQLKWFASAAALVGVIVASAPLIFAMESLWWLWPPLFIVAITSVPLAAGVAILRYRLYDIDRIISRTATYGVVTALLAGLYALVAVIIPATLLGTRDIPDWVIAGGTLLVAVAFGPVRRRVQAAVDRRFDRSRYDAERAIGSFTVRLREEVDLENLERELREVVVSSLHPSHASIWLKHQEP